MPILQEQHAPSRDWLEAVLSGPDLVRFAWLTWWAFTRIVTNPRLFERPHSAAEAGAAISSWLAQPVAGSVEPGERHWGLLRGLMLDDQTTGLLVMDAVLTAIVRVAGLRQFSGAPARCPLIERRQGVSPLRIVLVGLGMYSTRGILCTHDQAHHH